jgi:PAS domain S-box-containing protein
MRTEFVKPRQLSGTVTPGRESSRQHKIGARLTASFVSIALLMILGDAVVLWQFGVLRSQVEHISQVDQKQVAILRTHTDLLTFWDQLDVLVARRNAAQLSAEAAPLSKVFLEDVDRAEQALSNPDSNGQDSRLRAMLETVRGALPTQLDALCRLASAGDWDAVRLRLEHQSKALSLLTSRAVREVDEEVTEQRAQTLSSIRRVQRRVFLLVTLTAVFTLLIAGTLGLAITRSITQPLVRLVAGSKALARGDFQHQVAISGEDELAHLGRVFNDTARRLRDLYTTLQSSERELRQLIEVIPQHVLVAEPDGRLVYVNQVALEYTGLTLEDALSKEAAAKIFHPDDLERVVGERHRVILRGGGGDFEVEARVRRKDGEYRWFLIRFNPLRDEQGRIFRWYGTRTDIEDRKHAEDALRQAQAELAHVNRVSMMGELTASLAHEIRQPIAGAITSADACLRWLARNPPDLERARLAVARIKEDGTRAAGVISRLWSFYKKDTPPEREVVDVNEIIRDMIVLLHNEAIRYSVSVRLELAEGIPTVMAHRVQLQQVFMNLMLNAIEAMKDTGGGLTIKSQLKHDGQLLISVTDTGVGLPAENADRIFDAFYTTKPQGSGMGLAITRSIVESHGGRLWATANEGPGTTFNFTLRIEAEAHT